jgi:glycogen synthase
MAGREDKRQKGYDVFSTTVDQFLSNGGTARFMLFPIPGDDGLVGIRHLESLAIKYKGSVLVLPFIFREGYQTSIQGAAFGVMPSLYEPFGMANEFYLNGTMGIGRATGGILQQIIPYREAGSFSQAVRLRSDRWFSDDDKPTGLLYREPDNIPSALDDWKAINMVGNFQNVDSVSWIELRRRLPLFNSMVDELLKCFHDAVDLFINNRNLYFRMLAEGHTYIDQNFTWKASANEYSNYFAIEG